MAQPNQMDDKEVGRLKPEANAATQRRMAAGRMEKKTTLTMTHSDEVTNGSQKPGPTDVSGEVISAGKEDSLVHCIKQCTESRV